MQSIVPTLVISLSALTVVAAQDRSAVPPGSAQFDVVSIKRSPRRGVEQRDPLAARRHDDHDQSADPSRSSVTASQPVPDA